jgi:phosphatidylserine decarboxylase
VYRLLHIVPKNVLSHFVGIFVRSRLPFGFHTAVKNWFIKHFRIDGSEAEKPVESYVTLGDFFIRRLKPGARPLASSLMISPVDGTLTQGGRFVSEKPRLTQIKGLDYSLPELAGPGWELRDYLSGGYLTIYLAPYNYHRIHAPIDGEITRVSYLPGALWPVNTWSVNHIPGLFVVNERIIVEISGPEGKVLVIMVGATNVGRITLDFHAGMAGNRMPRPKPSIWVPPFSLPMKKGQGLGCFELGSTVILIASRPLMEKIDSGLLTNLPCSLRMGQGLTRELG